MRVGWLVRMWRTMYHFLPLGVVFTNMKDNGQLPPHVVYKIRQNASFVQSTRLVREKFWYPGPHNWGYLYYQFGFVWIQVRWFVSCVTLRNISCYTFSSSNMVRCLETDLLMCYIIMLYGINHTD